MISIITAHDIFGGIGIDNKLPWNIPEDLEYFKNKTTGHTVVMGRKTYESIGSKPLKSRTNVVLSRKNNAESQVGLILEMSKPDNEIFIIGGSQIYSHFLPYANKLYITLINKKFDCDTFFPEYETSEWEIQSSESFTDKPIPYSFLVYNRKKTS